MGILQLARVLHVVIATHFWGYRSKSGISVSEITLGIAGMPNRIADNFNGVGLHLGCWVWVQIALGSSQLGKTVKLGTFMGLAAILTHYLKTIVNATFFYNPRDPK